MNFMNRQCHFVIYNIGLSIRYQNTFALVLVVAHSKQPPTFKDHYFVVKTFILIVN